MNGRIEFDARLGKLTLLVTIATCFVLGGVAVAGLVSAMKSEPARWIMVAAPLSILLVTALFTVRGYALDQDVLIVKRLGWETAIPLRGLNLVETNQRSMRGAIRCLAMAACFAFAAASGAARSAISAPTSPT